MQKRAATELIKTAMQILALLCLAAYFSLLFHKAFLDLPTLARQYAGSDFWPALGRHFLRNLGGG
jgi:hypothetical protein